MRTQRRINQTGRKRIDRSMVRIRLDERGQGKPPSFRAELDLTALKLPSDALVFVEGYHRSTTQRFAFGTVGEFAPPASTELDGIDLGGRTLFRVRVVDSQSRVGRLLAAADQIAPEDADAKDNKDYLIEVQSRDLGSQTWNVELDSSGDVRPVLQLNWRIPDAINQVRGNPYFQGLILPGVIREVYGFVFWDCEGIAGDDTWQRLWLDFGYAVCGEQPPEDPDPAEARAWIETVCEIFSSQHSLCDRIATTISGNDQ